jgi:hypothetical protein
MSLLLGKAIYSILSGDTTIQSYVGNKIYPLFAPDEVLAPFIVFERKNINANYTKDGHNYDDDTLMINVTSKNYTECVNIANAVRNALEWKNGKFNEVNILQCVLESANEDYGVDGFSVALEFSIRCK